MPGMHACTQARTRAHTHTRICSIVCNTVPIISCALRGVQERDWYLCLMAFQLLQHRPVGFPPYDPDLSVTMTCMFLTNVVSPVLRRGARISEGMCLSLKSWIDVYLC